MKKTEKRSPNSTLFREQMKRLMAEKGYTVAGLAKAIDCPVWVVRDILRGHSRSISLKNLGKLRKILVEK